MAEWFNEGYGHQAPERNRVFMPFRFGIKKADIGKNFIVCFVDDRPFCITEHKFNFDDGSWDNYATCIAGLGDGCPACEVARAVRSERRGKMRKDDPKMYYQGFLTVLDETGDGAGNYLNRLRLFPCNDTALKHLKATIQRRGGTLVGLRYVVSRTGDKTPVVGDDWELCDDMPRIPNTLIVSKWARKFVAPAMEPLKTDPMARVVLPTMPEDMLKQVYTALAAHYQIDDRDGNKVTSIEPFDYRKFFAPMSREQMTRWLSEGGYKRYLKVADAVDDGSSADSSDEFGDVDGGTLPF